MRQVAIVGVGLIGGSFGLALRKAGFSGTIVGVSSERTIEKALACGAIDRGMTLDEAAESSDLLFLAQPIYAIMETLEKLLPTLGRNTLVTDAGSTKREITETAARFLPRDLFLGGHPMAGGEKRGVEAARADLFVGRRWVLDVNRFNVGHPAATVFRKWIREFGAQEVLLDPKRHDRLVAWASHLPQLASTALASAIQDSMPEAQTVAGPGVMDMTRLAMSSWDLWNDILATNSLEVGAALDAYISKLQDMRQDMAREFANGSAFAKSLRGENE
ncbi:MAG: prephenate dehydrogenase [Bryobacterales bacterium]|jgi:prephenate dehydrogenase|nr:prephenate dehydrogenase [Bryobacterales bacterium]